MTGKNLIKGLKAAQVLRSKAIEGALKYVDRARFVLPQYLLRAYEDYPLPIGFGQTISQPLTVVFMLELLDVKKGDNILEIGAGSGWQTALLSYLTGPQGKVVAIERIPELAEMAMQNVSAYPALKKTVRIECADGSQGFLVEAPFNKIIAAASANTIPEAWLNQMKIGAVLVAPVQSEIVRIKKIDSDTIDSRRFPGFAFVPLIEG